MWEKGSYFGLIFFQMLILKKCHERKQIESSAVKKNVNICYKYKFGLTLGRAGAGKSHQSSTKKLICFYGGAESLHPHLHLVALRSGRRGDTPPVGRQDALLKATGKEGVARRTGRLTDTESAASPGGRQWASGRTEAHYNPLSAGKYTTVEMCTRIHCNAEHCNQRV